MYMCGFVCLCLRACLCVLPLVWASVRVLNCMCGFRLCISAYVFFHECVFVGVYSCVRVIS